MPILYPFKTSATVKITANKKPSDWVGPNLINEAAQGVVDTTQWIGTKIRIWAKLVEDISPYPGLGGKPARVMRQLGTGTWTKIADVTTDNNGYINYWYTLVDAGVNNFRVEWDGDATYSGSDSKAVKSFAR